MLYAIEFNQERWKLNIELLKWSLDKNCIILQMAFRKMFLTKNVWILILVKAPKCAIGSVPLKELFPEQNAIMLQNPYDISRLFWVAHRIRSHYNMIYYDNTLYTTVRWLSLNIADILCHWCSLQCSVAITYWNSNIVIWWNFFHQLCQKFPFWWQILLKPMTEVSFKLSYFNLSAELYNTAVIHFGGIAEVTYLSISQPVNANSVSRESQPADTIFR